MKKKKRLTAIATGLFAMLLMVGCSKAEEVIEEKPAEPQQTGKSEEKEAEKETIRGQVTDLTVRKTDPASELSISLTYQHATATLTATGNENLVLDPAIPHPFHVNAQQNDGTRMTAVNKDDYITLYGNKAGGNGSLIEFVIDDGYQITGITVNYKSNANYAAIIVNGANVSSTNIDGNNYSYVIDYSSFSIKNIFHNPEAANNEQVFVNNITINYEAAANDVAGELETQSALSYSYLKTVNSAKDTFGREITASTNNTYKEWTYSELASGITYSGKSAGSNESIQLNNSSPNGIVTTTTRNGYLVKRITIEWYESIVSGKILYFFGKNAAYSGPADLYSDEADTKGTQLGYLRSQDRDAETHKHSFDVTGSYAYLGIKANEALYVKSIEIEWEALPVYTYSDVAIRFGGLIKQPLWARLENIQGYGVMVAADDKVDDELKNHYNAAKVNEDCAGEDIKNYYTPLTSEKTSPAEANADQKPADGRVYYIWNLYQRISNLSLTKSVTSVAYIKLESEVVFLQEVTTNVSDLADELIASGEYTAEDFDGSLKNLADLA